jgi:DNA modification methylase
MAPSYTRSACVAGTRAESEWVGRSGISLNISRCSRSTRIKGAWSRRDIPDIWREPDKGKIHPHAKPIGLQTAIIDATTKPGDLVLDPCAGGFGTMTAAHAIGRHFLGCEYLQENDPALNPHGR